MRKSNNITSSETIRLLILECLRDRRRRFFDRNTPSINYLNQWGIRQSAFYEALIEDLQRFELFLKPKQQPADPQRYQFVMRWDSKATTLIHVTISPRGNPPRVMLAIHPHDTGYDPLPLQRIKPKR
jgi:hypothetical protein